MSLEENKAGDKSKFQKLQAAIITIVLVLVGINIYLWNFGRWNDYPTSKEIDIFFEGYRHISDNQQKIASLKRFLERLSTPNNVIEDKCLEYFINKLTKEFRMTESEAILIAVDETQIDAGFANHISGFYWNVKDTETFRNRYKSNPEAQKALSRCIGLSFSEGDFNLLTK